MMRGSILLCVALAACSKSEEKAAKHDEAPPKPIVDAKPEPQPATAAAFGKTVAPFGALTKVQIGMPEADARKAAPEFWNAKGGEQLVDSPYKNLHFGISIVDGRVNSLRLAVMEKMDLDALLTQAWGPPKLAKTSIDEPIKVWFDAAAGWRAVHEGKDGILEGVVFSRYLPAEKLLGGSDTVEPAAFTTPLIGKTPAELRAAYPDAFDLRTKEQKVADGKRAEDVAKWAGVKDTSALHETGDESATSVSMHLPPTEWATFYTAISPMLDKGKVTHYFFTITDDGYPQGRDDTLVLMKKKWGEPKVKKTYKEKLIFHEAAPFISAERDASDKGWEINVSPKDDD